MEVATRNLS